jgi:hypothetical protein
MIKKEGVDITDSSHFCVLKDNAMPKNNDLLPSANKRLDFWLTFRAYYLYGFVD